MHVLVSECSALSILSKYCFIRSYRGVIVFSRLDGHTHELANNWVGFGINPTRFEVYYSRLSISNTKGLQRTEYEIVGNIAQKRL